MEVRKIIFILSQENSQSFCPECTFQLEPNVGCAVFLPSKSLYCLNCYLNFKEKAFNLDFDQITLICSSDFYKAYHSFLEEFGVWTPEEELKLLEAVEKHGFGNWEGISYVCSKPASASEEHYLKFYVNNPFIFELDEFAKFKSTRKVLGSNSNGLISEDCTIVSSCSHNKNISHSSKAFINSEFNDEAMDWESSFDVNSLVCNKLKNSGIKVSSKSKSHENCNCPEELKSSSQKSQTRLTPLGASTGYSSGRDDFIIYPFNDEEFNLALVEDISFYKVPNEQISKLCTVNDSDLMLNYLSLALAENYNLCLKRREKMQKFVKEYSLLYNQNAFSWLKQYQAILNKDVVNNISKFLQFITKTDAKALLDNLKQVEELKARLQDLKYFRVKGLQTLKEAEVFNELKQERKKKFMKVLENIPVNNEHNFTPLNMKRYSMPLDIEILPGYDNLEDDEKELCASARIIPRSYEHFKNLLVSECHKTNGLRLAQARKLAKICVNRTRKIYDYLLTKGLIWLPPS